MCHPPPPGVPFCSPSLHDSLALRVPSVPCPPPIAGGPLVLSLLIGGNISAGGGVQLIWGGEGNTTHLWGERREREDAPMWGEGKHTHSCPEGWRGGTTTDPAPPAGVAAAHSLDLEDLGGVTRTFHVVLLDVLLIAEAIRPPVLGLQEGGWLGGGRGTPRRGGSMPRSPPPTPPPAPPQPFPVLTHLEQAGGRSHGAQQLGHPGAVVGPRFWGGVGGAAKGGGGQMALIALLEH